MLYPSATEVQLVIGADRLRRPLIFALACMNTRRIHELMTQRFPPIEHATREWAVVANSGQLEALVAAYIRSPEVLVGVHRKLGALLPVHEAAAFAFAHIGEGEIRIADRDFSGVVVVARNGVATGWLIPANPSLQRTASPPAERQLQGLPRSSSQTNP